MVMTAVVANWTDMTIDHKICQCNCQWKVHEGSLNRRSSSFEIRPCDVIGLPIIAGTRRVVGVNLTFYFGWGWGEWWTWSICLVFVVAWTCLWFDDMKCVSILGMISNGTLVLLECKDVGLCLLLYGWWTYLVMFVGFGKNNRLGPRGVNFRFGMTMIG